MNCDIAFSGEEALKKVEARTYNNNFQCYKLIIMDINMPGMDGVTCNRKIKQFLDENYITDMPFVVAHTAI